MNGRARNREVVGASRWFDALGIVAGAALAAGLVATWRAGDSDGERAMALAVLVGVGVVLVLVWRWFARLQVEVDERALRFRFGPVRCTLDAERIAGVTPQAYRWWRFGGWGLRFARIEGRLVRAWSVPFVRSGVAVETTDGRQYYVSSRAPEALVHAVRALGERRAG
ncbi:MAG: hypothetical protein FJ035_03020 [Chloroflexi bacterium]|nr:hypothetical protein [Chloroflexota bacterium]